MNYKYSDRVTRILGYSKEEAIRLNNDYIGPEHLMLGLIRDGESRAIEVLQRRFAINISSLKEVLERTVEAQGEQLHSTDIVLDQKSNNIMRLSVLEARLLKSNESDAEHILLAMLKQKDNGVARILNHLNVNYKDLYDSLAPQTAPTPTVENSVDFDEDVTDFVYLQYSESITYLSVIQKSFLKLYRHLVDLLLGNFQNHLLYRNLLGQ